MVWVSISRARSLTVYVLIANDSVNGVCVDADNTGISMGSQAMSAIAFCISTIFTSGICSSATAGTSNGPL